MFCEKCERPMVLDCWGQPRCEVCSPDCTCCHEDAQEGLIEEYYELGGEG